MARKQKQQGVLLGDGYGWTTRNPMMLTRRLQVAAKKLEIIKTDTGFDSIAVAGSSGAVPGAILAIALQVPLIFVRKRDDNGHGATVECMGRHYAKKYIILDDFICSGGTVRRIYTQIQKEAARQNCIQPECVGVYLYDQTDKLHTVGLTERVTVPVWEL